MRVKLLLRRPSRYGDPRPLDERYKVAKYAKDAKANMDIDALSYLVIGIALEVHTRLGPGLFESVYETVLADEMERRGLRVQRQAAVPLKYGKRQFKKAFKADLIVERILVVEVKSQPHITQLHVKQLLTYLRLMDCRLGLILNFGAPSLRHGIKRVVNNL